MDVQFDEDRQKATSAKTRLYSPSKTGDPTPILEDPSMPIRPQPTRETRKRSAAKKEVRFSPMSKVLILLSIFVIAATALFGLFGAAEYAKIISDTASVNKEIENYNDQISQLKKTQSSMNDFATINEVCRRLGMTMNWYKGSTAYSDTNALQTFAPDTPAPTAPNPDGTEP